MHNRIPQAFIDELLSRVDIYEIISTRIQLKKSGSNYAAWCPFHTEHTPSFTVSQPKQFYHCFGCGAHGNAISFLMNFERQEFIEAVEILAAQAGIEIPHENKSSETENHLELYKLLSDATSYYQQQLKQSATAQDYLKNRALSAEMIKRFNIGYAPSAWDNVLKLLSKSEAIQQALIRAGLLIRSDNGKLYDRFRDRIIFPIRDTRGRVIGFGGRTLGNDTPKYLNSPETPVFHKGQELYGLYEAKQAHAKLEYIIIVEGYMDVIALAQHGFSQVVATLGTATSSKHIQRLFRYTHELIFCFDGDSAGQQAAWRALEICLPTMRDGLQIRFMFLPSDEDPDSLVRKLGPESFKTYISNALPLSEFFFTQLTSQVNLNAVDGKARLAKLAQDKLNKIPNGVFQQLMIEKLNALIGTDVKKFMSSNTVKKDIIDNAKKPIPSKLSPLLNHIVTLLIQYPSRFNSVEISDEFKKLNLPGISLLLKLFDLIKQQPKLTTGAIMEYWRDSEELELLAKLAAVELIIPAEGVQQEFLDSLQRVLALERDNKIQALFAKARQENLSTEEKKALMELIGTPS
jgi:DNA primase